MWICPLKPFIQSLEPLSLQNAEHQSFTQNIEGVEAVTRVYPLAGTTRAPHGTLTEATESTIAQ